MVSNLFCKTEIIYRKLQVKYLLLFQAKVTRSGRKVKLPKQILPEGSPQKTKKKTGTIVSCFQCAAVRITNFFFFNFQIYYSAGKLVLTLNSHYRTSVVYTAYKNTMKTTQHIYLQKSIPIYSIAYWRLLRAVLMEIKPIYLYSS